MNEGRRSWKLPRAQDIHFDIDEYLNRLVFQSQLYRLPKPVSRFLGYREKPTPDVGNILIAIWAFVGTFCGIALVGVVFHYSDRIKSYHAPVVFASLGASAILDYNMIQSPLAQPRAAIIGTLLATTSGVAVSKLFMLSSDFESIRWIAGAASCGVASSLMTLTNTVHPPGGATALLAAVDPTVNALGWMFIPLVLLATVLMLGVALLINNIQRQYPIYWWSPKEVGWKEEETEVGSKGEVKSSCAEDSMKGIQREHLQHTVIIGPDHVALPKHFTMGLEEVDAVDIIREWLRDIAKQGHESSNVSLNGRYGQ